MAQKNTSTKTKKPTSNEKPESRTKSSSIKKFNGRERVIITNISPQVEQGKFPAKTAIEEPTTISADIFGDGHDELGASVFLKHEKDRSWKEFPMEFTFNDQWKYEFTPEKTGFYRFKIQAWIDHFKTWRNGLKKKFEAGQKVDVELQIGAELLEDAAETADAKLKKKLKTWSREFQSESSDVSTVMFALGQEVSEAVANSGHKPFATTYEKVFTIEAERRKALFSSWYELFPRSASETPGEHGTFKDVERLLPRVEKMGFDVLYFPPIHPIGEKNRKGRNNSLQAEPDDPGSPWAIGNKNGGHKDIHPELGSLKDFKSLISKAKKHDIEIAMDIAYQCAPDHPYVKDHPEWFKWRPDGSVQYAENPPKKYEDILPINFESDDWENLWLELKSVVDYWIDQGVNIFRIDNPHTKAFPFWEWMIAEVRKEHPQIIFLAEAFTRPRLMERLAKVGFTQSYTYFTWRTTKQELEEYMTELTQTNLKHYFRPNFWPNTPDILPPHLTHGGDNAHVQRLILAATLSSSYGIYGPVYEFGINTPHPSKEEYIDNEKYEIKNWEWDKYTRIKEVIARVNRIRKENRALQSTWNIQFAETTNDQIICYTKADEKSGNIIIVAVNLDPHNTQSSEVKIPIEKLGLKAGLPYQVTDLLAETSYRWLDHWNYVELNPNLMPAHIFKVEQ